MFSGAGPRVSPVLRFPPSFLRSVSYCLISHRLGHQANCRANWRQRQRGESIFTSLSECNQTSFLFYPNAPRISRSSGVAPLLVFRMRSASSEWQAKMMWPNVSRFPVAIKSIVLPSLDETACTGVGRCSIPVGSRESIESTYFVLLTKIRMRCPCELLTCHS